MDIVDLFQHVLSFHGLSQRTVCDILGFTSPNQMTRILKRQVSHKYLIKFGSLLLKHQQELELTEGEISEIQACCLSSTLSTDDETAANILFDVISDSAGQTKEKVLKLSNAAGEPLGSFETVFSHAVDLNLSVVGCLSIPLCRILASWETHCHLNVDHYHSEGKTNTQNAQYLHDIWAFYHKPWFHPYCIKRKQDAACGGLMHADIALIDASFSGKKRSSYLLVSKDLDSACLLPFPDNHLPARALLFSKEDIIYPLEMPQDNKKSYIEYLRYLQDLECNHRVFLIKEDICLNMIPAEIQLCALQEGPMRNHPGLDGMLNCMYEIEKERFVNNRDKKKHQYYLHTYNGLLNFMKTGMEIDHFWGFRPFTPGERYQILLNLYERTANSRYTHLFFLKPEVRLIPDEIGWYEDRGICFLLPQTQYHIENEHSELLFRDLAFCRFFSGYFRDWICQRYAFSEADSLEMLRNLLNQNKPADF